MRKLGALLLLCATSVQAGPMVSLDPGVPERASEVRGDGSPAEILLPKSFLGRKVLHYAGKVASSRPSVDLGAVHSPTTWMLDRKDGTIEARELARPFADSDDPTPMGTWHCQDVPEKPDSVRVTDVPPLYERGQLFQRKTEKTPDLKIQAMAPVTDVRVTTSEVSFIERYFIGADPSGTTTPAAPDEIAYRRHFLIRDPELAPRPYSTADHQSVCLFSLAYPFRGNAGQDGDKALRWNLAKPIHYVIHPTVPEKYRPIVTRAILSWNAALKRIAGVEPITVEVGAPDAVPGTPGMVVVYWVSKDRVREYRGVSGEFVHPETGEILGGHILLSEEEIFGARDADYNRARQLGEFILPPGIANHSEGKAPGGDCVNTCEPPPAPNLTGAELPQEVIERGLEGTVAHETGHTLGLRHNFKGSADVSRIPQGEYSTSVMDYMRQQTKPTHALPYDFYALALQQGLPLQADFTGPFLLGSDDEKDADPECNVYDEGIPLVWAQKGLEALRRIGRTSAVLAYPDAMLDADFDAYGILVKVLVQDAHVDHERILSMYESVLADQGTDVLVGGGTNGKALAKQSETPPEVLASKNAYERYAALGSILNVTERVGFSSGTLSRLTKVIVPIVIDAKSTDAFFIRYVALRTLTKMKSLLALDAVRVCAEALSKRADAAGPTTAQDVYLLGICTAALKSAGMPTASAPAPGPAASPAPGVPPVADPPAVSAPPTTAQPPVPPVAALPGVSVHTPAPGAH